MALARQNLNAGFKMRECMNPECKKKFLSAHAGHRHCNKCRQREDHVGAFGDTHKVHI